MNNNLFAKLSKIKSEMLSRNKVKLYTIYFYNPDDNKPKELQQNEQPNSSHYAFPNLEPNPVSQKHRILDQSITIASLYDDLKKYKPYIHLHTPEDLRESDLQFQEDTYNSYISTSAINLRGKN